MSFLSSVVRRSTQSGASSDSTFISLRSCLNQSFFGTKYSSGFALVFALQTVPKRRYKSQFDVGINHPAVNIETKPLKPTGSGTVHDLLVAGVPGRREQAYELVQFLMIKREPSLPTA